MAIQGTAVSYLCIGLIFQHRRLPNCIYKILLAGLNIKNATLPNNSTLKKATISTIVLLLDHYFSLWK